jgi:hypothetical protein
MAQYNFGVGQLFITPSGSGVTPINVGTLKDVSLDISRDVKELTGANAFPEDIALGKGKITGKAKVGRLMSSLIASLLAGSTTTAGQISGVNGEAATIPSEAFTYTVANGATFVADGGVYDVAAGKWMTYAATPSAADQYSVNTSTGQYTFYSTDAGKSVLIYYSYKQASTGTQISYTNQLMGSAVQFSLNVFNTYKGVNSGWKLYAVVFPKLQWDNKQDDYTEYDVEFQAFADSNSRVMDVYTNQ